MRFPHVLLLVSLSGLSFGPPIIGFVHAGFGVSVFPLSDAANLPFFLQIYEKPHHPFRQCFCRRGEVVGWLPIATGPVYAASAMAGRQECAS